MERQVRAECDAADGGVLVKRDVGDERDELRVPGDAPTEALWT